MKIELSNGVVVIPTPEITLKIKEILFNQEIIENSTPASQTERKPKTFNLPGPKFSRSKINPPEIKKPIFGEVKRYTPEEKEKIMRMYRAGEPMKDIADCVERNVPAVNNYIYGLVMKGELEKRSKERKSMFKAEGDTNIDDGEDENL